MRLPVAHAVVIGLGLVSFVVMCRGTTPTLHAAEEGQVVAIPRAPLGMGLGLTILKNDVDGVIGSLNGLRESTEASTGAISRARQAFWATYSDKPGSETAAREFARQLLGKDLYYLSLEVAGPNPLGLLPIAVIDGGIPDRARARFGMWVGAVRAALFGARSDSIPWQLLDPNRVRLAIDAASPAYERYALERDWAEFIIARREPAWVKTDEHYLMMLFMRDRGMTPDEATVAARGMIDALGPRTLDAVRRVRATAAAPRGVGKKDSDPTFTYDQMMSLQLVSRIEEKTASAAALLAARSLVPGGATLAWSDEPLDAIVALAATPSVEAFVHAVVMEHARRSAREQTWKQIRGEYEELVAKFGKEAVLSAAAKLKTASRYVNGSLSNPAALGVEPAERYEALVALLTGPSSPSTALPRPTAATLLSPIHAAWSKLPAQGFAFTDFWEVRGGIRQRDSIILKTRMQGLVRDENVAVHIEASTIAPGQGPFRGTAVSPAQRSAVLYPRNGPGEGPAPSFLSVDRWPWVADEPGAVTDSGVETLLINNERLECHWWSLSVPGTGVSKVAWFNDRVPGGLVRSFTRSKEGAISDVIAVFIADRLAQPDEGFLSLLAGRLQAPLGTTAKPSGAPPAIFNGQNWAAPPRIPAGTRFEVTTGIELGETYQAGPATIARAVVLNLDGRDARVEPGTSVSVSFQWVPQQTGRQRMPERLGRFNFGTLEMPFVVAPFTAVEVPQVGAKGGGLHRAPVPAGTVLVFEVQ